jgi:hypothetical protein
MCYLVAGCLPAPIDIASQGCRLVLLGLNYHSAAGRRATAQLLPLMKTELYEWARGLAGENATCSIGCYVALVEHLAPQAAGSR